MEPNSLSESSALDSCCSVVAFWSIGGAQATEGVETLASTPLLVSFAVVVTGLYGLLVLGPLWLLKFTRGGTSGVESPEP